MIISGIANGSKLDYLPEVRDKVSIYLESNQGKKVYVTFDVVKPGRTLSQNSYYHGLIIPIISDYTGHSPEEVHTILKDKYCPRFFNAEGKEYPRSTTRMNTKEFSVFPDRS